MHPAIMSDLGKARTADLHRQAERDTLGGRPPRPASAGETQQGPSCPLARPLSSSAECSRCSVPAGPHQRPDRRASISSRPYSGRAGPVVRPGRTVSCPNQRQPFRPNHRPDRSASTR